jgi:hypothetical protein
MNPKARRWSEEWARGNPTASIADRITWKQILAVLVILYLGVSLALSALSHQAPTLNPVRLAGDIDCLGGSGNGPGYVSGPVYVGANDPNGLDGDGDGWGCE